MYVYWTWDNFCPIYFSSSSGGKQTIYFIFTGEEENIDALCDKIRKIKLELTPKHQEKLLRLYNESNRRNRMLILLSSLVNKHEELERNLLSMDRKLQECNICDSNVDDIKYVIDKLFVSNSELQLNQLFIYMTHNKKHWITLFTVSCILSFFTLFGDSLGGKNRAKLKERKKKLKLILIIVFVSGTPMYLGVTWQATSIRTHIIPPYCSLCLAYRTIHAVGSAQYSPWHFQTLTWPLTEMLSVPSLVLPSGGSFASSRKFPWLDAGLANLSPEDFGICSSVRGVQQTQCLVCNQWVLGSAYWQYWSH